MYASHSWSIRHIYLIALLKRRTIWLAGSFQFEGTSVGHVQETTFSVQSTYKYTHTKWKERNGGPLVRNQASAWNIQSNRSF
jgi:hypothetical protein